jgi:hypothetical protein
VPTSPVDLIVIAYNTLDDDEQEAVLKQLTDSHLRKLAAGEGETARHIASLRRVADHLGREDFSVDEYRDTYKRLRAEGVDDVIELNKLIRFFGRWSMAKEALVLSKANTPAKIEARFRSRIVGKPRQFREEELSGALHRCAREIGRPPLCEEYRKWRQKEIDLASARGEAAHLPSYSAYYRRHGTWEKALVHYGFDRDEVYARLEREPTEVAKIDRYTDETLEKTLQRAVKDLGHIPMGWEFDEWRGRVLKKSRARSIVLPSSSPYRRRFGSWQKALLHFGYTEEEISGRLASMREKANGNLEASKFRAARPS